MRKSIFYFSTLAGILAVFILFFCYGTAISQEKTYLIGGEKGLAKELKITELESLGVRTIQSSYFDRAMDYQGSSFEVISFARLVRRFNKDKKSNAVLLNCFDDYQGILTIDEIRKYRLMLAVRIRISPEFRKPDWLNPLLIVVPYGSGAPRMERFMTANIRELRFVRLEKYYGPLTPVAQKSGEISKGFLAFKDNCIFCHSVKKIGGNKGIDLLKTFDFSNKVDRVKFERRFAGFHNSQNADKQNIEQFVSQKTLQNIEKFLEAVPQN